MAWTNMMCSVIALLCVTFLFEAVGFAIPLWMILKSSGSDIAVHLGLWYIMACVHNEPSSCKSKAIIFDFTFSSENVQFTGSDAENVALLISEALGTVLYWFITAVAATTAVGLTALAVLIIICCRCAGVHSKCWFIFALIFLLVGSLIGLAISILYAVAYAMLFSFASTTIDGATFPWSLLIFGLGNILGLITSVILIVVLCKWKKYGDYFESDDSSEIQMDDVAKHSYDNPRFNDNGYAGERSYDYSKPQHYSGSSSRHDYVRNTNGRDYRGPEGPDYSRGSRRDDYARWEDRDRAKVEYDQPYRAKDYRPSGKDVMYRPYNQKY